MHTNCFNYVDVAEGTNLYGNGKDSLNLGSSAFARLSEAGLGLA